LARAFPSLGIAASVIMLVVSNTDSAFSIVVSPVVALRTALVRNVLRQSELSSLRAAWFFPGETLDFGDSYQKPIWFGPRDAVLSGP
jgi:hypothetical protein